MDDNFINKSILTFFAVVTLFILGYLIKYFRVGFRILLTKLKVLNENDERSYTELIAYGIGKLFGRIFYGKK
jgi:hypothetical protein